ncbi:MAG TPA: outer membrane protein assembly factor BamC [Burkholderiales bacterium]|nr:outer membrane protein assembly factor BamC [Burkholderiales bacterium]
MNPTQLFLAAAMVALALSGCSGKVIEGKKIDYKSAGKAKALDVPADLSTPPSSDRYIVPESTSSSATYSEYTEGQANKPGEPSTAAVLPVKEEKVRVERSGSQRWLVVEAEPDALWPVIREFWQDNGFLIEREEPEIGIMETDWAENRAKIPDSAIRNLLGKVIDQSYTFPERDKFRTRLERGSSEGTTEIYISHRGVYQVLTAEGRHQADTKWQMRPTDPELEAEMLYLLMNRFGAKKEQVEAQKKAPVESRAELSKNGDTPEALLLRDSFDRAWRRVGLALDRVGFTVEDRDRSKGMYFVRYVDPDAVDEKSESFMSKMAFWRSSDAARKQEQYRISVANADKGSEVRVLNAEGKNANTPSASRILSLLQAELK